MNQWDTKARICALLEMKMEIWVQGKKDSVTTWSHTPFKTWKINSPSRKRRKMNLTDSFSPILRLLLWACASRISLNKQGHAVRKDSHTSIVLRVDAPRQAVLLTQMWLSGLSQKWKKSASSPNADRCCTLYCYSSQHSLQIWIFIPLNGFVIQKGRLSHSLSVVPAFMIVFQCQLEWWVHTAAISWVWERWCTLRGHPWPGKERKTWGRSPAPGTVSTTLHHSPGNHS